MRLLGVVVLIIFSIQTGASQFNLGVVSGGDLYQRFVNPIDDTGADRSSGSAIMNASIGLKVWIGAPAASLSIESYLNSGSLALNIEEYKGLGALSFPVLAKLNFKGLSAFNIIEDKSGWSIGGGIQWNKTEVYGLSSAARAQGVERKYFPTYIAEVSFGTGTKSKVREFYIRYGLNPELSANSLNIGVNTTFSIPFFKVPEFNMKPGTKEEEIITI